VLHGVGALGQRRGDRRIDQAIAFLRRHQLESGAWWGRWAVNYLPATSYILTGLRAVGVPAEDEAIRRAVAWMGSCQNADGGFGETPDSCGAPELAGRGPSSVQVTGIATWALCAAGEGRSPAVARAVRYLLSKQREDGGWDDRACYGVIFPHRYYYYNDAFPSPLAMEALRAWLEAATRAPGDAR
jgi:squalene-hopene/tetraprenyl-beta-curcumene cyclase